MTNRGARQLFVLTTGGSIDKVYSIQGQLEIGPPVAAERLERAGVTDVTVMSVMLKDSLDLTPDDRERLRVAVDHLPSGAAVVLTHGTDTMSETARYLAAGLSSGQDKTIVITGALQPAALSHTDADFNLGSAVLAARTLTPGVYVVMHGMVFDAARVRKDMARGRFVSD
jgi:L-asparaginase